MFCASPGAPHDQALTPPLVQAAPAAPSSDPTPPPPLDAGLALVLEQMRDALLNPSEEPELDPALALRLVDACSGSGDVADAALGRLGCDELPEVALQLLATNFGGAACASSAAAAFARTALLPRLCQLSRPATRPLINAIIALRDHHSAALLREVAVPLFTALASVGASGAAALTEVLTRLLKELAAHMLVAFVDEVLCGDKGAVEPWSEPQAAALQVALSRKPALTDERVVALLQQMDVSAVALRKSPKFSNLVFTLVRSYGAQLGGHVELARSVAGQLETFMRATSLAAVEKLG